MQSITSFSLRGWAVATVAGLALLALPALASAHPGVYYVTAKISPARNEVQTITVTATGGTFKPSAGATAIPFNATAAQAQSALQADPAIGTGNVTVAKTGNVFTLTYGGVGPSGHDYEDMPQIVPDTTSLTGGTATAATTTQGVSTGVFPDDASLTNQEQASIANDGYALGIRETNGVATNGIIQYKVMPGAFRSSMSLDQMRTYAPAQTGLQAHATCQPGAGASALLDDGPNVLAWQEDPFFNYIPWQKTAAQLGDVPSTWIPLVQTLTGVNLSSLNTVADFTQACTDIGGTYKASDTTSSITTAQVSAAVTPLNAQIAALQSANSSLQGERNALQGDKTKLEADLNAANSSNASLSDQLAKAQKKIKKLKKRVK